MSVLHAYQINFRTPSTLPREVNYRQAILAITKLEQVEIRQVDGVLEFVRPDRDSLAPGVRGYFAAVGIEASEVVMISRSVNSA